MPWPADSFHRLWLDQLRREHEDICFQYRITLPLPVFELSSARKQQGCWLPELHIMRISKQLIINHPWDVVIMVLKHEMAHQICSELFNTPKAGHGPDFKRACTMLGVTPPYNSSTGDLIPVTIRGDSNQDTLRGRKTIDKVRKLLSLAGSDNEHEAALAMQRATQILGRHNLDMAALHTLQPANCTRRTIQTGSKQIPAYRRAICAILREYFFVQVICSTLYDAEKMASFKTIELLGRNENVPIAEHCYHFLEQQLSTLWESNRHLFKGNKRTARNSYYLGVLHGFSEKLAQQSAAGPCNEGEHHQHSVSTSALVIANDRGLQKFIKTHFPRLTTQRTRGTRIYKTPYDAAVSKGKKLILRQTLREKKQGIQGLLAR